MRLKSIALALLALLLMGLSLTPAHASVTVSGQITGDTTWTADDTIIVAGSIDVFPNVTLTIEPGANLMVNPMAMISADGTILAIGTESEPITLTSRADTVGGTPINGLWLGFQMQTQGSGEFEHVHISYVVEGIHTFGCEVTMRHCSVTNFSSRGYSFDGFYSLPRPVVELYSCTADQTHPVMIGEGQGAFAYRYLDFRASNCSFSNSRVGLFVYSYKTYNPLFNAFRCEMSNNTEEGILVLGCG